MVFGPVTEVLGWLTAFGAATMAFTADCRDKAKRAEQEAKELRAELFRSAEKGAESQMAQRALGETAQELAETRGLLAQARDQLHDLRVELEIQRNIRRHRDG